MLTVRKHGLHLDTNGATQLYVRDSLTSRLRNLRRSVQMQGGCEASHRPLTGIFVALCNRAVRDQCGESRPPPRRPSVAPAALLQSSPNPLCASISTSLIRILFLRLVPPLGTSYVVGKERRKREGVWPGLRGGLRGGGCGRWGQITRKGNFSASCHLYHF